MTIVEISTTATTNLWGQLQPLAIST